MANKLTLKVSEARPKDVGRAMARIDPQDMAKLGVEVGDIIRLKGKRETIAKIMPAFSEYRGKGLIQIDGLVRENAKIGLDEKVEISKTSFEQAKKITLAPLTLSRIIGRDRDSKYIGTLLDGLPMVSGDHIRANLFGTRSCDFTVTDTDPKGAVVINPGTIIKMEMEEEEAGAKPKGGKISYEDIGGLKGQIQRIREMIELPLKYPQVFEKLGIEAPKGVFLHGPPGCGKTLIARAVANETDAYFTSISGPEIMGKFYGESEGRLRSVFEDAQAHAPAIVFIDEIDAIAPKREEMGGEKQVEKRVVAQLLALLDGLESRGQVIVIGATNIPNAIDPALRRPGRFDREISIPIPDRIGRLEILEIHSRGMPLAKDVDLKRLADITHGYVGADMEALAREAAMICLRKILPEVDFELDEIPYETIMKLEVTQDNFLEAMREIDPSAIREVFVEVPDVKWSDIGGLGDIKKTLIETVEWPLKYASLYRQAKTKPAKGILLSGPPGTGKTLLAKALANESEVNFISVKGPELFSKYIGESERGVREVFRKAKQAAPCITGDALITLENGQEISAEAIFNEKMLGVKVWSFDSNFKVIPKRIIALQKKPSQDLLEVQTNIGKIKCTPDHKFPVLENGRLKWVEGRLLNKGDYVATPRYIRIPDRKIFVLSLMPDNISLYGGVIDDINSQLLEKKIDIYEFANKLGFSRKQVKTMLRARIQRSRKRGNSRFFLTLKELKKGGYLSESNTVRQMVIHTKGWGQSRVKPLNVPVELDEDIMYVYGLLWSDGSFNKNGRTFCFCGDNISLHFRLRDIIKAKFGIKGKEYIRKNAIYTFYNSKTLHVFFSRIERKLLEMPERLLVSWLRGVCDGDGSITKDVSKISIGATKKGNRELLQKILLRVGIPTVDHRGNNLELTSQSQLSAFIEKVGFEHPQKMTRAKNYIKRQSRSRLDIIPVGDLLAAARRSIGLMYNNLNIPKTTVSYWECNRSLPSRDRIQTVADYFYKRNGQLCNIELSQIHNLAYSDIFWASVVKVKKLPYTEEVYDFQIEDTQNFMANGMFIHNCIVFFDEIDSLVPQRGSAGDSFVAERVIGQFLAEMDGVEEMKGVVVLAATNRLDRVDSALLRPGRFDLTIELPQPDEKARLEIFKVHTKGKPMAKDADLEKLARDTAGLSGADIEAICREASMTAIRDFIKSGEKDIAKFTITKEDFKKSAGQ